MAALGSPLMDDLFDTNSGVQIKRSSSFLDEGYWTPSSPSSEVGRQVRTSASIESLVSTINNAKPLVAVVGVGYVGLHLVDVFSSQYEIIGFDVSQARIDQVSKQYRDATDIRFTTDPKDLSEAVLFLVSVPTLLLPDNSVDTSYIQSALSTIGNYAQPGSTIVVESSVAVGMTRQLLGPLAAEKHLFAGMSPEVRMIPYSFSTPEYNNQTDTYLSYSESTPAGPSLQHAPSPKSSRDSMTLCPDRLTPSFGCMRRFSTRSFPFRSPRWPR